MRLWQKLVCILAIAGASACDNGGGDDAGTMMPDSGPQTMQVFAFEEDPATGDPVQVDADFSCLGSATAPPATGTDVTFTVRVDAFGEVTIPENMRFVSSLAVQFFPDNVVPADPGCTGTCQMLTTDGTGSAMVTDVGGSWYAYRIPAGMGTLNGTSVEFVDVVQYNEAAPTAPGTAGLNAVTRERQDFFISLLGVTRTDGTAVVTGTAVDCMGRPISNARVRAFNADGAITLTSMNTGVPREFYFTGSQIPLGTARDTAADGLYGAANLPVATDRQVRIEIWGSLEAGAAPVMLGCEQVQVNANGLTLLNVGPDRSDGPSNCSG